MFGGANASVSGGSPTPIQRMSEPRGARNIALALKVELTLFR